MTRRITAIATPAPQARVVTAGTFLPVPSSGVGRNWAVECDELKTKLDGGVSNGNGVAEQEILDWFGSSIERISLLCYATHGFVPDYVAREMTVSTFRADFAWIVRAKDDNVGVSTVCFVELEGALPTTLFEQRTRKSPYFGVKFLDGFSQLVDWCAFGKTEAENHHEVANALKGVKGKVSYQFCLIAGMDEFMDDAMKKRMTWWQDNLKLGHGTTVQTFTDICWSIPFRLGNQAQI